MPRPPRIDFEGALHHVFDRGNRRQVICEAELVSSPAAWAWSSYGALRAGAAPAWLAHDAVLDLFGGGAQAAVAYERLILDEDGPDPPSHVQGADPGHGQRGRVEQAERPAYWPALSATNRATAWICCSVS